MLGVSGLIALGNPASIFNIRPQKSFAVLGVCTCILHAFKNPVFYLGNYIKEKSHPLIYLYQFKSDFVKRLFEQK